MANRFIAPFFDAGSGITPEDGAKLFFFDTGTSNPKNTFTDQGATTPNSNPVIANQNGVFADIFIDGVYKVRLTDKNDVQIWEADPVFDIISSTTVTSITALKAVTGQADNESVNVLWHTAEGDKGGGLFRFDAGNSDTDNNGTTIQPDSGTGRWVRVFIGPVYAAWFGAVAGVTFTKGASGQHGGVVSAGTNQSVAIQAAIDAVGAGGVVRISEPYYLSTGLTLSNGAVLIGEGLTEIDELQDGSYPGLYTDSDITLVTISVKRSYCRDLMLVGSGDLNDGNTPQTSVVGTGIDCQTSSISFYNIQFRNLKVGYLPNNVSVNFYNAKFRQCIDCVLVEDASVCNIMSFFGGSALVCDNVLINSGSTSAEQTGINFFGFTFEFLVRAVKGDFENVNFQGCWFERTSTTGLNQSRSNLDNVPLEPLGTAKSWGGDNNSVTSTANGALTAAGESCLVGAWHTAAQQYRRVNYGLDTEVIISREGHDRVVFDGEIYQDLELEGPRLRAGDVTVDGDTALGYNASIMITSAINTPRIIGVTGAAAVKGTLLTITNLTETPVILVNFSAATASANRFLTQVELQVGRRESQQFIYAGSLWLPADTKLIRAVETLTGAGAVLGSSGTTWVVTTGTDALTLSDGREGDQRNIIMKTDGGTGTLTPSNLGNGSTITFDDAGDSASLLFTNGNWYFMGGTATLA